MALSLKDFLVSEFNSSLDDEKANGNGESQDSLGLKDFLLKEFADTPAHFPSRSSLDNVDLENVPSGIVGALQGISSHVPILGQKYIAPVEAAPNPTTMGSSTLAMTAGLTRAGGQVIAGTAAGALAGPGGAVAGGAVSAAATSSMETARSARVQIMKETGKDPGVFAPEAWEKATEKKAQALAAFEGFTGGVGTKLGMVWGLARQAALKAGVKLTPALLVEAGKNVAFNVPTALAATYMDLDRQGIGPDDPGFWKAVASSGAIAIGIGAGGSIGGALLERGKPATGKVESPVASVEVPPEVPLGEAGPGVVVSESPLETPLSPERGVKRLPAPGESTGQFTVLPPDVEVEPLQFAPKPAEPKPVTAEEYAGPDIPMAELPSEEPPILPFKAGESEPSRKAIPASRIEEDSKTGKVPEVAPSVPEKPVATLFEDVTAEDLIQMDDADVRKMAQERFGKPGQKVMGTHKALENRLMRAIDERDAAFEDQASRAMNAPEEAVLPASKTIKEFETLRKDAHAAIDNAYPPNEYENGFDHSQIDFKIDEAIRSYTPDALKRGAVGPSVEDVRRNLNNRRDGVRIESKEAPGETVRPQEPVVSPTREGMGEGPLPTRGETLGVERVESELPRIGKAGEMPAVAPPEAPIKGLTFRGETDKGTWWDVPLGVDENGKPKVTTVMKGKAESDADFSAKVNKAQGEEATPRRLSAPEFEALPFPEQKKQIGQLRQMRQRKQIDEDTLLAAEVFISRWDEPMDIDWMGAVKELNALKGDFQLEEWSVPGKSGAQNVRGTHRAVRDSLGDLQKSRINLYRGANPVTVIHEPAHAFLARLSDSWKTRLQSHFGENWNEEAARSLTRYFFTGQMDKGTPGAIRRLFTRIANTIKSVFQGAALPKDAPADIRQIHEDFSAGRFKKYFDEAALERVSKKAEPSPDVQYMTEAVDNRDLHEVTQEERYAAKNADTDTILGRLERSIPSLQEKGSRANLRELYDAALSNGTVGRAVLLATEVAEHPRVLSKEEVVAFAVMRDVALEVRNRAKSDLANAKPGSVAHDAAVEDMGRAIDDIMLYSEALKWGGTEQSWAFSFRKAISTDDAIDEFDAVFLKARAFRIKGKKPLTDSEGKRIDRYSERATALDAHDVAANKDSVTKRGAEFVKGEQVRRTRKPKETVDLDKEFLDLKTQYERNLAGESGIDDTIAAIAKNIAARKGIKAFDDVVGFFKDIDESLSRNEIADAIDSSAMKAREKRAVPLRSDWANIKSEAAQEARLRGRLERIEAGLDDLVKRPSRKARSAVLEELSELYKQARTKERLRGQIDALWAKLEADDILTFPRIRHADDDPEIVRLRFEREKLRREVDQFIHSRQPRTKFQKFLLGWNIIRTLKTTGEMSGAGIQGGMNLLGALVPIEGTNVARREFMGYARGVKTMFTALTREGEIKADWRITEHPDLWDAERGGLVLTHAGERRLGSRDELIPSNLLDIRPNFGENKTTRTKIVNKTLGVVPAFQASFRTGMNEIRVSLFSTIKHTLYNGEMTLEQAQHTAQLVNNMTSTHKSRTVQSTAVTNFFSQVLFAPRITIAAHRLGSLTPVWTVAGEGLSRAERVKIQAHVAAKIVKPIIGAAAIIYAHHLLSGEKVETDPRSSAFGMMEVLGFKVGTAVQPLARWATFYARLFTGQSKTADGELVSLRNSFTPCTDEPVQYGRSDAEHVIARQVRSKAAPLTGFIGTVATGQQFSGQTATVSSTLREAAPFPITYDNLYDMVTTENPDMPDDSRKTVAWTALALYQFFGGPVNPPYQPRSSSRRLIPRR